MDQDSMLVEKYMEQVTHIMDQIESRKLQLESISAQAYQSPDFFRYRGRLCPHAGKGGSLWGASGKGVGTLPGAETAGNRSD